MKPIISHTDYNTIKSLIANYPSHLKTKEIGQLKTELERADIVEDEKLTDDVVRINSYFEAEDLATKKILRLTLTLPDQANLKEQKISVFSPLGVALIGYKKGMSIEWMLPGGAKTIKLLHVANQAS